MRLCAFSASILSIAYRSARLLLCKYAMYAISNSRHAAFNELITWSPLANHFSKCIPDETDIREYVIQKKARLSYDLVSLSTTFVVIFYQRYRMIVNIFDDSANCNASGTNGIVATYDCSARVYILIICPTTDLCNFQNSRSSIIFDTYSNFWTVQIIQHDEKYSGYWLISRFNKQACSRYRFQYFVEREKRFVS